MAFGEFPPGSSGPSGSGADPPNGASGSASGSAPSGWLQSDLFGAPRPIQARVEREPSVESVVPSDLKTWYQEYCAARMESMSKYNRAILEEFKARTESEAEADRQLCRDIHNRARGIRRHPRGNPSKGGAVAGQNRRKSDDTNPPTPPVE